MGYNLLINGLYWGYNPFTNQLLTSWDIQAGPPFTFEPFESSIDQLGWILRQLGWTVEICDPETRGGHPAEVMISWESKGLLTLIFIDPLIKLRYLYRDHHGNLRVPSPKLPKTTRNVRPTSRRTRSGLSWDA